MVDQLNDGLLKEIQEYGCYYLSILYLVESLEEKKFTLRDVNDDFMDLKYFGAISDDAFIEDPVHIFKRYGIIAETMIGHDSTKVRDCTYGEVEILKFKRPGMVHFVVGDGKGNVLWDPYPDSKTVRVGKLVGKRIFRLKVA